MSEYDIAIKIAGQLEGSFKNAIKGAQQGLSGLGISGKVGSLALKGVGLAAKATVAGLAAAGAGIAAVGAYSVNVGKEFESQMSTVAAISGATGSDFEALEQKAKQMGATTSFSATEAGQAMEYMAMAGWKTQDMVDGIEGIMNLAAASGEELALTSDIVTDALTAFGLSAKDSGHFADVLAAASSNANTNVAMLGESFQYAAPVAGSLGISAEDTSIALGLMANAGIKASSAGTALRTGLTNLAKPTKQMQTYMDRYNISMVENADGSINLRDTMVDLRSKMSGLSESEQAAAAAAIFGKNSMAGWLAIVNSSEQDFEKLTAAIDNANGSAAEMAAIKLDNLEGDITLLKSAAEAFGISVYEHMQNPLRNVAQYGKEQLAVLQEALDTGGFEGLTKAIGTVLSDGITKIAENAPDFINAAADLIESFLNGIDSNSDSIGSSIGRLMTVLGSAIIRLAPRLAVTGVHILAAIGKGIIDNLDVLKDAAFDAVEYLWNAVKEGFAKFKDFLGDDEVEPFKKVLALLPALVAGFAIFDGIGGAIKGFVQNFKGAGKAMPGASKGFLQSGNQMSKVAKNLLGVGAGLALAAAGIWLLVDAAQRISQAGPGAVAALILMVGAITALLVIASVMGEKLQAAQNGLLAFGGAILMAAAGMALMSFAAIQLANAGPLAFAGLAVMIGGMIALMAIAGAMGTQLETAAPGLLAFGGAILMAAAGMSLMALAATQVATAGTPAIVTMAIMLVGLIALMAVAAALGPALTAAAVGLIAFGAAMLLAGAGMMLLTQAAIQIAAAGPGAGIALALMMAGMLAFGAVAGLLAPILLIGAAAIAALGAAFMLVAGAAMMGAAALQMITVCLPMLSAYGVQGGTAIMTLGAALMAFAAGAALAGAGALAAGAGFAALALAAAGCDLAFAPLALEMTAVAASIAIIGASAQAAAAGLQTIQAGTDGISLGMAKLALVFAPVAAAIAPFAAAMVAGAAATTGMAVAVAATAAAMAALAAAIALATAALLAINMGVNTFKMQAVMLGVVTNVAAQAFVKFGSMVTPVAPKLLSLVAPMTALAAGSTALAAAMLGGVAGVTAMGAALAAVAVATAAALVAFRLLTTGVSQSMTQTNTAVRTAMTQMRTIMVQGMTQIVTVTTQGFTLMVAVVQRSGSQMIAIAVATANGIRSAFNIDLTSAGINMMQGLINGMNVMKAQVEQVARDIANTAANAVNSALQIHSPSQLMMESGQYTGEGLAIGMESRRGDVATAAQAMTQPVQDQSQQMRDMSAPMNNPRTGVIGETIEGVGGNTTNNTTQTASNTFNFNPTYVIEGHADQEVIQQANKTSQADFEKMMNEWIRNNGRTAFA